MATRVSQGARAQCHSHSSADVRISRFRQETPLRLSGWFAGAQAGHQIDTSFSRPSIEGAASTEHEDP